MADHDPDGAMESAGSGTGEEPPRQPPDGGAPGPADPSSDPAGDEAAHPAPGHPDPAARDMAADQQDYHELTGALGHRVQQVYNTFYGRVDAAESVFGFGAAASPGLAPGSVEPAEIDRVLAHYLHPDAYDETAGRLQSGHILVLTGEEGSGRRAGAFAMLRDLLGEDAALRSLSPANSLTHLAAKGTVKPGSGYVILDYAGETESDAVQDYNLRKLQEELRRRGSYLVLTASPADRRRLALKEHCVPWTPPDPLPLFAHCADRMYGAAFLGLLPAETLDELRGLVAELRRPRDIVRAARQLADGPQAALEDLRDSAKQTVRDWFQTGPAPEDLLPIAALAFAEGLPERTFEELVVLLDDHVRNGDRPPGEPVSDEDAFPATRPPLRQSRAAWNTRAPGIAGPVHRGDRCRSERTLVFASPRVRGLVIGELYALYGYELWYPLRRWLHQLALDGGPRVREEVARGVALLARHALPEVEENLLPSWSDGLSSQRLTAAFVLQFMCDDERLASQALATALGWSKSGSGQLRAITAAMAFAGEAGALYRMDALNCLWGMTVRGQRVAAAARRSLVLLLATAAAETEAERAEFTLRYLRTQLAHARELRDRAAALESVLQVLEAEGLTPGVPLTAELLRRHPRTARHLGSLWSTVLLSVRRARAVTALVRTLAALRDVPSATGSVRELGEAMRGALDRRQWQGLQANMSVAVRHPDYAVPGTQHLVQVLLGNLRRHGSTRNSLSLQGG
ncbi:hypothetical protein CG747_05620 [Streptomyces sp. CB02959]|uniref:hypothetical protein n=1 Tax=Streptomyces sp. CB02959 TaxID=2020330 RepID=UPI000C276FA2|nr:hypothetical protein [Streptomyces sp. CB02959]PJN42110.1 hypothetical protein CG747_05620 [Streptomyces sp. CB02959]